MNTVLVDSRGPLHIVLHGFIVVGRYENVWAAWQAAGTYADLHAVPCPSLGTPGSPKCICAWCRVVMRDGHEPATHGICCDCRDKFVLD